MNAAVLAQLRTDAANLIGWGADTLTYQGASYPCAKGRITNRDELKEGGIYNSYAGRVLVRSVDFTALPKPGEWVTINGTEYLIGSVSDADQPVSVLTLEHGDL